MDTLFIFPGQGAQKVGMLKNIPKEYVTIIREETGIDLKDEATTYSSTVGIQLALLAKGVSSVEKIKEAGFLPEIVAGHSIGAFSAAVACGAITYPEAVQLVYLRATMMEQAYGEGYGMGVVIGLLEKELADIVHAIHTEENPVYLANKNSATQFTISGTLSAIEKVLHQAQENGASKAKLLKVPVPSHCPLMNEVSVALKEKIATIQVQDPKCLYISNHTARGVRTKEEVIDDLVLNVIYPVEWNQMMDLAIEYRPDVCVEFEPGNVLTKLMQAKDTPIRLINCDQVGVDGSIFLLNKWRG